jgi:hypothetical protein
MPRCLPSNKALILIFLLLFLFVLEYSAHAVAVASLAGVKPLRLFVQFFKVDLAIIFILFSFILFVIVLFFV